MDRPDGNEFFTNDQKQYRSSIATSYGGEA
jgi:hypothetical protein